VGRHSSEQRTSFYRSIFAWAVPWVVIAAILGVAVWFAVGALSGSEVTPDRRSGNSAGNPFAQVTPTPTPRPSPSPTPSRTPRADKIAKKDKEKPEEPGLITEGVSLQVLNGTGGIAGAADSMADQLSTLGYEIVAVGDGLTVDRTTVYWSGPENESAARALAGRFGWIADIAPPNLSEAVDVHVVVGPDERPT
jgi:LytR cell envelope-related transcriptional attenuator